MSGYPEGVSSLTPEIAGVIDGTHVLAERRCSNCGTVSDISAYTVTDGVTVWDSWECDECGHENTSEFDATVLVDDPMEVPC